MVREGTHPHTDTRLPLATHSETPLVPDLSATTTPVPPLLSPPLPSASPFLPAGNRVRGWRGPPPLSNPDSKVI